MGALPLRTGVNHLHWCISSWKHVARMVPYSICHCCLPDGLMDCVLLPYSGCQGKHEWCLQQSCSTRSNVVHESEDWLTFSLVTASSGVLSSLISRSNRTPELFFNLLTGWATYRFHISSVGMTLVLCQRLCYNEVIVSSERSYGSTGTERADD